MKRIKGWAITCAQVAGLWLFAYVCDLAVNALHVPIPGSIMGCLLVFVLLQLGLVRMSWIENGANWLLRQMLLFFVPSAVGVIQYKQLVRTKGARLLFIIVVSTALVMAVTGKLAEWLASSRSSDGLRSAEQVGDGRQAS